MNRMNIRQQTGRSPEEMMKAFLDRSSSDLEDSLFSGKVVNNNDPDKEGKCQIRIYGIFGDEIPDADLPWALPDFSFIGSKVGSFVVPPKNAIVKVYFDNGDIYLPHYTTKAVDTNNLPSQRLKDYPDTLVLLETDQGDFVTLNRKTGRYKVYTRTGAQIVLDADGEATVHGAATVRIDSPEKVVLGDTGGFVVTSPVAGLFTTQNGHVLTAQEQLRA